MRSRCVHSRRNYENRWEVSYNDICHYRRKDEHRFWKRSPSELCRSGGLFSGISRKLQVHLEIDLFMAVLTRPMPKPSVPVKKKIRGMKR